MDWRRAFLSLRGLLCVYDAKRRGIRTRRRIVGACLRVIHYEGLVAAALLMVLVVLGRRIGIVSLKTLRIAVVLLVVMSGLTALSQFGIIPRMETYRIAAGGDVNAAPAGRSFKDSIRAAAQDIGACGRSHPSVRAGAGGRAGNAGEFHPAECMTAAVAWFAALRRASRLARSALVSFPLYHGELNQAHEFIPGRP